MAIGVTSIGFAAVGIGAAIGGWARWILGILLNPNFPSVPLGTLTANLIGGYIVGVAVEYLSRHAGLSPEAILVDHPRLTLDDIRAVQAFAADYLADEDIVYG